VKGSIPLYHAYDTNNNNKQTSDITEESVNKTQKIHHLVQSQVDKHKASGNYDTPAKRIKMVPGLHVNEMIQNEPKGLIWDGTNDSCAVDALFSVL
jgi:hypothetical protein